MQPLGPSARRTLSIRTRYERRLSALGSRTEVVGRSDSGRGGGVVGCCTFREMGGKRCDITGEYTCHLDEMGRRRWDAVGSGGDQGGVTLVRDERTKRV